MSYRHQTPIPTRRKVVITGYGLITSLGQGKEVNGEGFRTGRQAFSPITLFPTAGLRVSTAGVVDLDGLPPPALAATGEWYAGGRRKLDRASDLMLRAAAEAWEQSGWGREASKAPLVLGTSAGGMGWGEAFYRSRMEHPRNRRNLVRNAIGYQPQSQAQTVRKALGMSGGEITILSNACASGANGVGHAAELVARGRAERVLCGGYDALAELVFAGFDSLRALSPSGVPRPFDADRDGLALGEGAAAFTLETEESARGRGAEILAEIAGYGVATDAHHLTQPHPEGDAALASMLMACARAGMRPEEIDYVNAHGTGTPLNDEAEGRAICRWAGDRAPEIAVSSTKSSTGHLLGGAGAVEAAVCLMAMAGGWVPPTPTVTKPADVCAFDLVREPRSKTVRAALSNSFGFGGANATLIFRTTG